MCTLFVVTLATPILHINMRNKIQINSFVWKPNIFMTIVQQNEDLENLIRKKNIVMFIKSQILRWAGHVMRMDTTRTVKKLTEWEPCSSRTLGRPRLRWLDQEIGRASCRERV